MENKLWLIFSGAKKKITAFITNVWQISLPFLTFPSLKYDIIICCYK